MQGDSGADAFQSMQGMVWGSLSPGRQKSASVAKHPAIQPYRISFLSGILKPAAKR